MLNWAAYFLKPVKSSWGFIQDVEAVQVHQQGEQETQPSIYSDVIS